MSQAPLFLWETHGIHVGTGRDHVKHGIDELEPVVEQAMRQGFPAVTFVIHSPRLTRFRPVSRIIRSGGPIRPWVTDCPSP